MSRRLLLWLPVVVWAAGIFALSSLSHPPTPGPSFPFKDKVGHWALYFTLAVLITRAGRQAHNWSLPRAVLFAILLTSVYGASDEFHQAFVPHRTCDAFDWMADTLGGVAGAAAYYAYETIKANRRTA